MLASLVPKAFHLPGWVYEEKYDGYRILAYKEGSTVTLLSRNQLDRTATFAAIAVAVEQLPDTTLLLDGEVVAFDSKGVSRFQLLQRGGSSQRFAVFDCIYRNGRDLRSEPLSQRRDELEACLEKAVEQLLVSRRLAKNGLSAFKIATRRGLEGIVAKDSEAVYEERRSRKWLKVKAHQEEEFVIGGFTAPEGSRQHFGALLLGAYSGRHLHFVGKVGTGFTQQSLAALAKNIQAADRQQLSLCRSTAGEKCDLAGAAFGGANCISGMDSGPKIASAGLSRAARRQETHRLPAAKVTSLIEEPI